MSCTIGAKGACGIMCGVVGFLVVSAITLLVMGILGATHVVPMAPIGADLMLGISSTIILGLILGTIRAVCCRK